MLSREERAETAAHMLDAAAARTALDKAQKADALQQKSDESAWP